MGKVSFVFALHNHQPVGNFEHVFKESFEKCYKPFLCLLEKHPMIKVVLHYSGSLIDWIENNVPDNGTIYSDRHDAILFRLKRPAKSLPHSDDKEHIDEFFNRLKMENNSYLIVFKEYRRPQSLSNNDIIEINQEYNVLIQVADFPEAAIYKTVS